MIEPDPRPLVYSCSGCSSVAQLANRIAVNLDRAGRAEMSCIAGVGGGVRSLVKTAQSGRPIIALDGCALQCTLHCLQRVGVTPHTHLILTTYGIAKRAHEDASSEAVEAIEAEVTADLEARGLLIQEAPV
ncbi:MAG TPA: putative zinc-binding protein [Kiritimatiellia bacterium]|nr:putative zinc-binding protein [Kiritimatiellia bacterium]